MNLFKSRNVGSEAAANGFGGNQCILGIWETFGSICDKALKPHLSNKLCMKSKVGRTRSAASRTWWLGRNSINN
jgi:hypothetical protein